MDPHIIISLLIYLFLFSPSALRPHHTTASDLAGPLHLRAQPRSSSPPPAPAAAPHLIPTPAAARAPFLLRPQRRHEPSICVARRRLGPCILSGRACLSSSSSLFSSLFYGGGYGPDAAPLPPPPAPAPPRPASLVCVT